VGEPMPNGLNLPRESLRRRRRSYAKGAEHVRVHAALAAASLPLTTAAGTGFKSDSGSYHAASAGCRRIARRGACRIAGVSHPRSRTRLSA
jgi:hypothetical protein